MTQLTQQLDTTHSIAQRLGNVRFFDSVSVRVWIGILVSLFGGASAFAIAMIPGATTALQFDRVAIADGQWWRLLTCHWTHFGMAHLVYDAVAFVLLAGICFYLNWSRTWWCLICSTLGVSLVVWGLGGGQYIGQYELSTYRGLSGIDSALFTLAVVLLMREAFCKRHWTLMMMVSLTAIGFIGKVAYESTTGLAMFVTQNDANFVVVPQAHLAGAFAGFLCLWPFSSGLAVSAENKKNLVRHGDLSNHFETSELQHRTKTCLTHSRDGCATSRHGK